MNKIIAITPFLLFSSFLFANDIVFKNNHVFVNIEPAHIFKGSIYHSDAERKLRDIVKQIKKALDHQR